jgi:MerR family mercuric resistance operon transcriptional regulator
MTISEVARQAKVGVETIRFYEREGLLAQPRKPQSGYRQYAAAHVERIRFLKQCQSFGFTLSEAGLLADSLDQGKATCQSTCDLAERKLTELRAKISEFRSLEQRLETLLDSPCRREKNAECSVVAALTRGECG